MPSTSTPLTQAAANDSQASAQAAVIAATDQPTETTRTVVGTMQAASQTAPGAAGSSLVVTGASTGIGAVSDLPELSGASWIVTFLFQGIKHHRWINQDRDKWWILPLLSALVLMGIAYLMAHGDLWTAAAHAARGCGMCGANSAMNYHTIKPLGIFSSAADIAQEDGL